MIGLKSIIYKNDGFERLFGLNRLFLGGGFVARCSQSYIITICIICCSVRNVKDVPCMQNDVGYNVFGNCNSSLTIVPYASSTSKSQFFDSDETPIKKEDTSQKMKNLILYRNAQVACFQHSYSCGNMIPIEKSCNDEELAIAVSKTIFSERVENEQSIVHKKDVIKSEPDVTGVADEK